MFSQPKPSNTVSEVVEINSASDSSEDCPQIISVHESASHQQQQTERRKKIKKEPVASINVHSNNMITSYENSNNQPAKEINDGKKKRKSSAIPEAGFNLYLTNTIGFLTIPLKDRRKELKRIWRKELDETSKNYWCDQAAKTKKKKVSTPQASNVSVSTNSIHPLPQNSTLNTTLDSNRVHMIKLLPIPITTPNRPILLIDTKNPPPFTIQSSQNMQSSIFPSSHVQTSSSSSATTRTNSPQNNNNGGDATFPKNTPQTCVVTSTSVLSEKAVNPTLKPVIDLPTLAQLRSREIFQPVTCPLTKRIMTCPVMAADGCIYQKVSHSHVTVNFRIYLKTAGCYCKLCS